MTDNDDPHLSPEWSALVGATAILAEAAFKWDAARKAYLVVTADDLPEEES